MNPEKECNTQPPMPNHESAIDIPTYNTQAYQAPQRDMDLQIISAEKIK